MKRVLVVDDEPVVLEVLQRILNKIGYETEITDSGNSALQVFSQRQFDLVLLDVLMPEVNGFQIACEMRRRKPEQKIVIVTGLGADMEGENHDFPRTRIDHVLYKPFSFEKVKTIVDRALKSRPMDRSNEPMNA
jgi:CheY-like chemotaxis protein